MAHVYFHIDLNAFFASAEVLRDPSLKGKPIAVAGTSRRSVVATASYEARKFGVHSAMPIAQAKQLCPDLLFIPGHYEYYEQLSHAFIDLVKSYTPLIEQASIDECYADMTIPISRMDKPLDLAVNLQQRVLKEIGIPCSIGVAPNMFLAKMASDMKKPMGITVLRIRDVPMKMWPLPIEAMRGVGKKTLPKMEELGIKTIGDLAQYKDTAALKKIFGKNTDDMLAHAWGHDDRQIVLESDAKSIGNSETLLEDVTDYEEIRGLIRSLSRKVSQRLQDKKTAGMRVSVRIRYYDFRNVDRSLKLDHPVYATTDIFNTAMSLFDENWEDGEAVRLLGVTVSDLVDWDAMHEQIGLFDLQKNTHQETQDILDDLNRLAGSKAFIRAGSLKREDTDGTGTGK